MTMTIIFLEIFIAAILPGLFWYYRIIKFKHRWKVFAAVFIFTALCAVFEHIPIGELGLNTNNLTKSVLAYALFTALGVVCIFILAKITGKKLDLGRANTAGVVFLKSLSQEFVYRSFLLLKLTYIFNSVLLVIFLNSVLFVLPHFVYKDGWWGLIISFVAGAAFATMYIYFPNLILISLSHFVLLFTVSSFGIFKEELELRNV